MISFLCLAIPPILLLYIRSKVVGKNEHKTLENRIVEYCFALLFLNFIAISITYLVFHHSGRLQSALNDKTVFAFHYLVLVIVISIIVPMMEYFFKNHFQLNINLSETMLSIRKYDKTKLFYLYVFVLFVMNFIRIFDNSFWADEGYSISLAKMSIADMINATANDVHPPLHYFLIQIIYVFLTIFLYLLKCPQSLILSALRAFFFCGKPHISRSIFLYFLYQTWLKSW